MLRLFISIAFLNSLVCARSGRFGVPRVFTNNRLTKSSFRSGLGCDSTLIRGGEQTPIQDGEQEFEIRAQPAPGSPFHYAFPVHNLELAKHFYGTVLGCEEGRASERWVDFCLYGHQIVAHYVGEDYRCTSYVNRVDLVDEVPVPHHGIQLSVADFHDLADRLKKHGVEFIIEPHLRFKDAPGEQWTMFFKDPSGNNLEFKAMTKPENLFAKYNVVD